MIKCSLPVGIIYIGMSDSDMRRRLTYHVENNYNYGLSSYLENKECIYYFCESKKNLVKLEKNLILEFEETFGRFLFII